MYAHSENDIEFTLNGNKYDLEKGEQFKNGKEITKEEYIKAFKEAELNDTKVSELYKSLLKELETGRGKELWLFGLFTLVRVLFIDYPPINCLPLPAFFQFLAHGRKTTLSGPTPSGNSFNYCISFIRFIPIYSNRYR